jgi:hypothetical protein
MHQWLKKREEEGYQKPKPSRYSCGLTQLSPPDLVAAGVVSMAQKAGDRRGRAPLVPS